MPLHFEVSLAEGGIDVSFYEWKGAFVYFIGDEYASKVMVV